MIRKTAGLCVLAMLVASCAEAPKRVETQDGVTVDVAMKSFGALNSASRAFQNNATIFIRLRPDGERLVATELSLLTPRRASKEEEILAYVADSNTVLPAFDSLRDFKPLGPFFECALLGDDSAKVPKDSYHPCGSGSKLVAVKKTESAIRNAVALAATLGAASGMYYTVDSEKIIQILKDQKIAERVKGYLSLLAAARAAESEVLDQDKVLQRTAAPVIRVENKTGFPAPAISPRSIRYSFERQTGIYVPPIISLASGDPFGPARADIAAKKAALMINRSYRVVCPKQFEQDGFKGTISCDQTVAENNGTLAPVMRVTLDALYAGIRFPEYRSQDKYLALSTANNGIVVANLTNEYIEVQSIAIYGGKYVSENSLNLSLAPGSENRDPIPLTKLSDSSIRGVFTFDGVRKTQLERQVKFAVALKYRVGDNGNFKTHYMERQVLLSDLAFGRRGLAND